MSDQSDAPNPYGEGPMDGFATRDLLDARVARSHQGRVEVHGLDVAADLSRHYSFAEVVLTALLGDPPDRPTGELFEVCCHFAAPISVAEAPAHVSRLTEVIATAPGGAIGTTCIALAEQVQFQTDRLSEFREWLEEPTGQAPDVAFEPDEALEGLSESFAARVAELEVEVPGAREGMAFWPQLLAALHVCGLRDDRAIVSALVTARLPVAAAEGLFGKAGQLDDYPLNIPRIDYRHDEARHVRDSDTQDDSG